MGREGQAIDFRKAFGEPDLAAANFAAHAKRGFAARVAWQGGFDVSWRDFLGGILACMAKWPEINIFR
jgi:hypothetical protein